jgi:tetratricopeptide (TPR) repeat protein
VPAPPNLVDEAEAAVAAVVVAPLQATALARNVLARARGSDALAARSVARRALALAAVELGDLAAARGEIRHAVAAAARSGDRDRWAQAVSTAGAIRLLAGDTVGASRLVEEAAAVATGPARADVLAQRVWVRWRLGHLHDALAAAPAALAAAADRAEVRADVLLNTGCVRAELGDLPGAEHDLAEAEALYAAQGAPFAAAVALHDRALVLVRRGRLPEALRAFDEVEASLTRLAIPLGHVLAAQVEALLSANLAEEAFAQAVAAVAALGRGGERRLHAVSALLLARAALAAGRPGPARAAARRARERFGRLGDAGQVAAATHLELMARAALSRPTPQLADELTGAAWALETAGRRSEAVAAHVDALTAHLRLGRLDAAAPHRAAVARARRGPLLQQAVSWTGEARCRDAAGDRRGAVRAVERGLACVDRHRDTLGATELRAEASGHGAALAALGVDLALRSGRPDAVLRAAERWRAGALRRRPVLPDELGDLLGGLRRAVAAVADAQATGQDPSPHLARQAALEVAIRRAARRREASGEDAPARIEPVRSLREALGDRALVELVEHAGTVHAVVVSGGRASRHGLGAATRALHALDELGFALRRLGRPRTPAASAAAARIAAEDALAALDELLVAPLHRRLGDRPVVVVPTADLFAVPWAVLASLAHRPVTISPSASWWASAPPPAPLTTVLLVAGPGLTGAAEEVAALAARHPEATVLTGPAATADSVTAALPTASLAHLACHGLFRSDNPLCSSLELADGPLTVYDLEHLQSGPRTVVLSACDSGVPATRPGDELLGLVSSLFSVGSTAAVASTVPVPDVDTVPLMVALHDALLAGVVPAEALRRARHAVDPDTPTGFVARTAFSCFGAG